MTHLSDIVYIYLDRNMVNFVEDISKCILIFQKVHYNLLANLLLFL